MTGWPPLLIVWAMFTLQPVTISVYPHVSMSPATFRITVLAPRHKDNREICYGVSGPEDKRSCLSLDGDSARRVWTVYWELHTAGSYEASAVLTRVEAGRSRSYVDRRAFQVIGLEP